MNFVWAPEQRAMLTYGSSVMVPTHGGDARYTVRWVPGNDWLQLKDDGTSMPLFSIDPSTLQSPSIEWIRELAKKRLKGGVVYNGAESMLLRWGRFEPKPMCETWPYELAVMDSPALDRFRAAVAAIEALGSSALGGKAE